MGEQVPRTVAPFNVLEFYSWTTEKFWKTCKIFGKSMFSTWQLQRDTDHCNVLVSGPCLLSPFQHYSVLSRGREGLWTYKQTSRCCSWTREKTCAGISHPHTEKETHKTISPLSEGWRWTRVITRTGGRGRGRGDHLIPIPEWAVRYARDFSCHSGEPIVTWL